MRKHIFKGRCLYTQMKWACDDGEGKSGKKGKKRGGVGDEAKSRYLCDTMKVVRRWMRGGRQAMHAATGRRGTGANLGGKGKRHKDGQRAIVHVWHFSASGRP